MEQMIYLNGLLVSRKDATISPFDHGFLYGYSLFETMRAYRGHVFRLERHLARLARSARIVGLELGIFDLEKATYETLEANNLMSARVRLTISRGEGEMTPDPATCHGPTVLIVAQSYAPLPDETYQRGFKAVMSQVRQNSQSPLSRVKSANYLNNILARMEARVAGADEALLLNERGFLAEGSTSNIFLVSGGNLLTPSEESGALPGITREAVLELASALGIKAVQREVALEELWQADEAFLTNSLLEIMPVTEVGGHPIGLGIAGPVTKALIAAYKQLVRKEADLIGGDF